MASLRTSFGILASTFTSAHGYIVRFTVDDGLIQGHRDVVIEVKGQ